jgi:WhiB family redox-sensing transcriptional regulator
VTLGLANDAPWTDMALCQQVDPEMFFPNKGDKETARDAQRVCKQCPVMAECLDHAIATNPLFGIWGGMSFKQRQAERRRRRMEGALKPKPARTVCTHGHNLAEVGLDHAGQCRECRRNYDRQRRIDGRKND